MVMLAILKTIPCLGLAAFGAVDATPRDKFGHEPVIRSGHHLVLVDGIEPPTSCLQGRRSTC